GAPVALMGLPTFQAPTSAGLKSAGMGTWLAVPPMNPPPAAPVVPLPVLPVPAAPEMNTEPVPVPAVPVPPLRPEPAGPGLNVQAPNAATAAARRQTGGIKRAGDDMRASDLCVLADGSHYSPSRNLAPGMSRFSK